MERRGRRGGKERQSEEERGMGRWEEEEMGGWEEAEVLMGGSRNVDGRKQKWMDGRMHGRR